jgi:hypothetical protein
MNDRVQNNSWKIRKFEKKQQFDEYSLYLKQQQMDTSKIQRRGPIPNGLPSAPQKYGAPIIDARRIQRKDSAHERVLSSKNNGKQSQKTLYFKTSPCTKNFIQKS